MASKQIAVVGAGAAGLATAREMQRAGHDVTVFEISANIGGIWDYTPETEYDPMGTEASSRIHSSMYASLRTNLPRDLMAFTDYTFDSSGGGEDDWPRYPHHACVLTYLQRFARDFGLLDLVRFRTRVELVQPAADFWQVTVSDAHGRQSSGTFDAVAICNGHYSRPRIPVLPGISSFRGRLVHSHNYRTPDVFAGDRIALWGTAASGADISKELRSVCDHVHWCGNAFQNTAPGRRLPNGIHTHPSPVGFDDDGLLLFPDGSEIEIDTFMYCTGYTYDFPFLPDGIVEVDDNWVHPLYQDMLPPSHPGLAFIGIPYLVVPFPLFRMQARWFASVLAGDIVLPSVAAMTRAIDEHRSRLTDAGMKQRHFHKLGDGQPAYYNTLASQCGAPPLPGWFNELARAAQDARLANPGTFRDIPMPAFGPTRVATGQQE